MARSDRRRKRMGSAAARSRRIGAGRLRVTDPPPVDASWVLDRVAPDRHTGINNAANQASRVNVPWLFILEMGVVAAALGWLRTRLRLSSSGAVRPRARDRGRSR